MLAQDFDNLVLEENEASREMLIHKAGEYATEEDRLSNFKRAAGLRATNPADSLMGMLVKHFESVSDMARAPHGYTMERWDEKLRDIRNYTYLLKAVLIDIGVSPAVRPPNFHKDNCVYKTAAPNTWIPVDERQCCVECGARV